MYQLENKINRFIQACIDKPKFSKESFNENEFKIHDKDGCIIISKSERTFPPLKEGYKRYEIDFDNKELKELSKSEFTFRLTCHFYNSGIQSSMISKEEYESLKQAYISNIE